MAKKTIQAAETWYIQGSFEVDENATEQEIKEVWLKERPKHEMGWLNTGYYTGHDNKELFTES